MKYYFLGVCGTAMASLAVLLKQRGHTVRGSDMGIYPPMSDFLASHGIPLREGYSTDNLQEPFDLAVIGNAMSRGNVEVEAILEGKLPFASLPELIRREFVNSHSNIVITGTHGKTTTTSLMSWLLQQAGEDPTFLIGGIARNFDSSVRLGNGRHFVVEGDEYDCAFFDKRPKFVHYFPDYLIINNIEYDHADIYPDLASIKNEFRKLLRLVPAGGLVLANGEDPAVREVTGQVYSRLQTFGAAPDNTWSYRVLEMGEHTRFEIRQHGESQGEFMLPFPGNFQVMNALAVSAVARDIGIGWEPIRQALAGFKGVKRRMEYWGLLDGADVYDDFAHHPTAIAVTLQALRRRFAGRRLVALFEPRTNTTVRKVFQQDLLEALQPADVAIIPPVHRADRLPPEQRLSLEQLATSLRQLGREVYLPAGYDHLIAELRAVLRPDDVLILLTNGSLGGQYQTLRELIR